MKQTLVVAGREIREKSRLFLLAAILSVMPFMTLLLPSTRNDRASILAIATTFTAVALSVGLAIILGASTIGRELTERRLSFYFARPLSPAAIWFGKAGASILTSIACLLIVLTPAAIVLWKRIAKTEAPTLVGLGYIAITIIVLFLAAHTLSTMMRSRSSLFALDLVLAVATIGVLYTLLRPLFMVGADSLIVVAAIGVGIVLVLALAPLWQLAYGRTDIRRSHASLSVALWSGIAAVVLVAAIGIGWLTGAAPEDWDRVEYLDQSPNGSSVVGVGRDLSRMGFVTTWMINPATGERVKFDEPLWWGGMRYSGDGRVAAWMQRHSPFNRREVELHVRSLDGDTESIATGIRVPPPSSFVLSADGSRVAIAGTELLSIHDVKSGKLLASARGIARVSGRAMYFVTPDVVRLVQYETRRGVKKDLTIVELDASTKKLTQTGIVKSTAGSWDAVSVSGDGSRMLLRNHSLIADARTGAPLATIPVPAKPVMSAMLHDGSVVAGSRENGVFRVRAFNRDGQPMHDFVLPGVRFAQPTAQLSDGKLLMTGYIKANPDGTGRDRRLIVIDVARGVIERTSENLVAGIGEPKISPHLRQLVGNAPIVALDDDGDLVLWDPKTGTTKQM